MTTQEKKVAYNTNLRDAREALRCCLTARRELIAEGAVPEGRSVGQLEDAIEHLSAVRLFLESAPGA